MYTYENKHTPSILRCEYKHTLDVRISWVKSSTNSVTIPFELFSCVALYTS